MQNSETNRAQSWKTARAGETTLWRHRFLAPGLRIRQKALDAKQTCLWKKKTQCDHFQKAKIEVVSRRLRINRDSCRRNNKNVRLASFFGWDSRYTAECEGSAILATGKKWIARSFRYRTAIWALKFASYERPSVKPIKRTKCLQKISGEKRTAATRSEKRIQPARLLPKITVLDDFFLCRKIPLLQTQTTQPKIIVEGHVARAIRAGATWLYSSAVCVIRGFRFLHIAPRAVCVGDDYALFVCRRAVFLDIFNCLPAFIALLSKWPLFARWTFFRDIFFYLESSFFFSSIDSLLIERERKARE